MKKEGILNKILKERIISIVRLNSDERIYGVLENLVNGGIRVLEITSNTPNFNVHIAAARQKYPEILVGAGTITTPELAALAIKAGAQFLVTPNTDKGVVDEAKTKDIPVLMGALSPSEIANAILYGADIIKLFPAGHFGVSYFKALKGPFSDTRFLAVGGIGLDNIKDWLDAGIDGLGIGSTLVKAKFDTEVELEDILTKARQFKKIIRTNEHTN